MILWYMWPSSKVRTLSHLTNLTVAREWTETREREWTEKRESTVDDLVVHVAQ